MLPLLPTGIFPAYVRDCRDTVASVGFIPHTLPFTSSNRSIRVFRHAVALDERRARFQANLYRYPKKKDLEHGTKPGDMPKSDTEYATRVAVQEPGSAGGKPKLSKKPKSEFKQQLKYERLFNQSDSCAHETETDVLEVWFAGCHCGMCPLWM